MPVHPALDGSDTPLSADDFSRLMTVFEPFETAPLVAVGVSGGRDSLALTLLAHAWAQARGGQIVALTVDHALRSQSADEARQVGHWLAARGITHHTLVWDGEKPATGRQAAARVARYRLLSAWCRDNRALHLMLGHHAQDQAETVLLRKESGSGAAGLAGMSAIVETNEFRILRPLLNVARPHLAATVRAARMTWIDDPSNADVRYARPRLRRDIDAHELIAQSQKVAATGAARMEQEAAVAALLGRYVSFHPAGFAHIRQSSDGASLWENKSARSAMSQLLSCMGGAGYPPNADSVARLIKDVAASDFAGRTLGGCHISPTTDRDGRAILICRENRNVEETIQLGAEPISWDGRFMVQWSGAAPDKSMRIGALGDSWRDAKERLVGLSAANIPHLVRATLPAFWVDDQLVGVFAGAMFYQKKPICADSGVGEPGQNKLKLPHVRLRPQVTVSGAGFCLAQNFVRTMSKLGKVNDPV